MGYKSKIAVIGLGPSVSLYPGTGFDLTIGVNDAWRVVKTDYLVCLDRPERFTEERLKIINESMPVRFYSQLEQWAHRPDYYPIKLQYDYPKYVCRLGDKAMPKSMCSPFVACAIAYKFHEADRIELFGVDMTNHPLLHNDTLERIKLHFTNLFKELRQRGVSVKVNGNGILRPLNI